jgi:hypothetical protein
MIEPGFCEAQLQQLVNSEFGVRLRRLGLRPIPIIPSLPEECKLGWDTGFYISRGNLPAPSSDTEGCNLFIQYKLAIVIEQRGRNFAYWGEPYFQYKMAYSKRNNGYTYDYKQIQALFSLTQRGYPCFYIANETTELEDVIAWAESDRLISNCCIIDVRDMQGQHRFVTYTRGSDKCLLSSDTFEVQRVRTFDALISEAKMAKVTSLREDKESLKMILSDFKQWEKRVRVLMKYAAEPDFDDATSLIQLSILQKAIWDVFGSVWLKLYLD